MNNNKFYIMVAEWCPYCREAKDVIFKLTENYFDKGNIHILEESTDEYKKFAMKVQQFSIPTFIVVDENDKQVAIHNGPRSYHSLLDFYIENTETDPIPDDAGYFVKPPEEA